MEPGRPLIESANHRNERQRRIRCPFSGVAALQGALGRERTLDARQASKKKNTPPRPPVCPPTTRLSPWSLRAARFASEKCEQFYLRERVSA